MNREKNAKRHNNTRDLCLLAVFVALEIAMYLMGLGMVHIGPLAMSFLTVPVALGGMLLGPWQGALLGLVFGGISFWDAVSGASLMTGAFFQLNPFGTFGLCVGTRALMGLLTGLVFKAVNRMDDRHILSYFVGAFAAPFFNTLFFMGYLVLFFYQTAFIQEKIALMGAVNPIHFIILMVGVQALIEMGVCCLVGGSVAKGVSKALKLNPVKSKTETVKSL